MGLKIIFSSILALSYKSISYVKLVQKILNQQANLIKILKLI